MSAPLDDDFAHAIAEAAQREVSRLRPQPVIETRTARQDRVGNDAFGAMMRRMVKAYGRRAGYDIDALTELVELREMLDATMIEAVHQLRSAEGGAYSWTDIGRRLGTSAQAAQQRFGGPGARKPGGQPGNLR